MKPILSPLVCSALAAVACVIAAPSAVAQLPVLPSAGQTTPSFVMVPGLTVLFEPLANGQVRIVEVSEDPRAPVPRRPGQIAVAMSYNLEVGTLLEFNSGLDHDAGYEAWLLGRGPFPDQPAMEGLPTCPVRANAIASDQWPQSLPTLLIGNFKQHTGRSPC